MTQESAGQKQLLGLGRYRFQELLSTCFFGPRYSITGDGGVPRSSQQPPRAHSVPPSGQSLHPAQSVYPSNLRTSAEGPLAMRLVWADTQLEIERMARAAQSVRDLEHRAVLRPLQLVRSSTRLGVITHHLEGQTLAQLLANAHAASVSVPPEVSLRIMVDVIEGLDALRAHATATRRQDWLFGGLTPDNILVCGDGQSRLIDPGLIGAAARQATFAHEPAALAYTAPEQTSPDARYGVVSDVFSLGVMLWELLTGRPLFAADSAAQTLENLHRAPIARVQRHQFVRGEPIAFALAQAVANALKRNPAQRIQDYDALLTALVQAGPIGRPEAVAELVRRGTRKRSISDIKERIGRMQHEAELAATTLTAPRIALPVSIPKTQSSLDRPRTLPPNAPALSEPHARSLPPDTTEPPTDTRDISSPWADIPPDPDRQSSTEAQPVADDALTDEPLSLPAVASRSGGPIAPRLGDALVDQVSAFPIGNLRRRTPQKRGSRMPAAIAALTLLGLGVWTLRVFTDTEGRSDRHGAAAGDHAPTPRAASGLPAPTIITATPSPSALPAKEAAPPSHVGAMDLDLPPAKPDTAKTPAVQANSVADQPTGEQQQPPPESKNAADAGRASEAKPKRPKRSVEARPAKSKRKTTRVSRPSAPRGRAATPRAADFPNLPPPEPETPLPDRVLKITPVPAKPSAFSPKGS